MTGKSLFLLISLLFAWISLSPALAEKQKSFDVWLAEFRIEAAAKGISPPTIRSALSKVQYLPKVIELQKNQPEFKLTLKEYLHRVAPESRVARGREVAAQHQALLEKIRQRYGVPPEILAALWGIETDFGKLTGGFPVIDAMATLAFRGSRSDFFKAELVHALRIIDRGHISADKLIGSWAGATGQLQFMPSTFHSHAVDYSGDGRIDIWTDMEDIFASAANYLSRSGWLRDQPWGWEACVPGNFDWTQTGLGNRKSLADWKKLGITPCRGEMPDNQSGCILSVTAPEGREGPTFMATENYRAIYRWNRSHHFVIAVGTLSDRIAGQ